MSFPNIDNLEVSYFFGIYPSNSNVELPSTPSSLSDYVVVDYNTDDTEYRSRGSSTNSSINSCSLSVPSLNESSWTKCREARYFVVLKLLAVGLKDCFSEFNVDSYQHLSETCENPALKKAVELLSAFSDETVATIEDARAGYYRPFLESLRQAQEELSKDSAEDSISQKIMQNLCFLHFTVDFSKDEEIGIQFITKLLTDQGYDLDKLDAKGLETSLKTATSDKSISIIFSTVMRRIRANNPTGLSDWDPVTYSVRSKLLDFKLNGKELSVLRTACPVIGSTTAPEVDPLFVGYLQYLKSQGKKHLYVNNQSADFKADHRSKNTMKKIEADLESIRVAKLRELEGMFPDTFCMMSLAHDSHFYMQKESEEQNTHEFISEFVGHVVEGREGYFLPKALLGKYEDTKLLNKTLQALLTIFKSKHSVYKDLDVLNAEQKKLFLNQAYAVITLFVSLNCNIDLLNNTCKDGVDRAAGANACLKVLLDPTTSNEELAWILSFPAIINHARPPKAHRHERSMEAMKEILEGGLDKDFISDITLLALFKTSVEA